MIGGSFPVNNSLNLDKSFESVKSLDSVGDNLSLTDLSFSSQFVHVQILHIAFSIQSSV